MKTPLLILLILILIVNLQADKYLTDAELESEIVRLEKIESQEWMDLHALIKSFMLDRYEIPSWQMRGTQVSWGKVGKKRLRYSHGSAFYTQQGKINIEFLGLVHFENSERVFNIQWLISTNSSQSKEPESVTLIPSAGKYKGGNHKYLYDILRCLEEGKIKYTKIYDKSNFIGSKQLQLYKITSFGKQPAYLQYLTLIFPKDQYNYTKIYWDEPSYYKNRKKKETYIIR